VWDGLARLALLLVVARAADVGMDDRRTVRGTLVCGVSIELVVEDGADRAVGEHADLDGARGGGFQTCDPERPRQSEQSYNHVPSVHPLYEATGCSPQPPALSPTFASVRVRSFNFHYWL
jgi:hypothetical protein